MGCRGQEDTTDLFDAIVRKKRFGKSTSLIIGNDCAGSVGMLQKNNTQCERFVRRNTFFGNKFADRNCVTRLSIHEDLTTPTHYSGCTQGQLRALLYGSALQEFGALQATGFPVA